MLAVSPVAEAGGGEVLLVGVLSALRRMGAEVSLVVLGRGPLDGLARDGGLTVIPGPTLTLRRPGAVARSVAAVRGAVAASGPDVVLASHPKGQVVSRLACAGVGGIRHVTQLYDPPCPNVSERLAARLGGRRLAITEETAAAYRAWRPSSDPEVISPGVDLASIRRAALAGDGEAAWLRAGLGGGGPRVVTVGRLQRFKGPFDLVAAAAKVVAAHPGARFLVIGPDSPREPDLASELEAAIARSGLTGSVALSGRLPAADLAATVAGATLLVHPAHREPFGLAVVEAMALGTPVVAYSADGPASILGAGGGRLVPVGDVAALAEAVSCALAEPEVLARWGEEGRAAAEGFDVEATARRYLEVLAGADPGVVMLGAVPPGPSGVRDHGSLLAAEMGRRGVPVVQRWVENRGDRPGAALAASWRLLAGAGLGTRARTVVWHYSPVPYGFRGLPCFGVLAGLVLRARGRRVVTVLHELAYTYRPGLDPWRARVTQAAQRAALSVVLAGSHEVVVTTDRRREALGRRLRRPAHTVPVFPTVPMVVPGPPGEDPFVVAVPGFAGPGSRPDLVVQAVSRLHRPDRVRLVLVGAPGGSGPGGRRWRQAAERAGMAGIEFTGEVAAEEYSRRLAGSHVAVVANDEGPSSRRTSLAAALALGVAVVAVDGPNRWEELARSGAVRLVAPSPAALARALDELRRDPVQRRLLGERGAEFAARHMSVGAAADTLVGLVGTRAGPSRRQPVRQRLFPAYQRVRMRSVALRRAVEVVPGARSLHRRLFAAVRPDELTVEVDGLTLAVDPRDSVLAAHLVRDGVWEKAETAAFLDELRPGMVVVDVGANVGYYSLLAARAVGPRGRVVAVEADPRNFALLRGNVERNGLGSRVTLVAAAAADRPGTIELFRDDDNLGAHSLAPGNVAGSGRVEVPCVTLDEVVSGAGLARVDVVKMDTQGAEGLVLAGAGRLLGGRPLVVFMELWPQGLRRLGTDPAGMLGGLVEGFGFEMSLLDEGGGTVALDGPEAALDRCPAAGHVNLVLRRR